jgi:hypothetical protein
LCKVLFLVHVEKDFEMNFPYEMIHNIKKISPTYDIVVNLNSKRSPVIFKDFLTWNWGWGYEEATFKGHPDELKWVIDAGDHYTWVPRQLRENVEFYRNNPVVIGGGNDGECLKDWECVLKHMQIPYKKDRRIIFSENA